MLVSAVNMLPRYVDGKKFTETTLKGKYKGYNFSCTTIYMNDQPLLKRWNITGYGLVRNLWKTITGNEPSEIGSPN